MKDIKSGNRYGKADINSIYGGFSYGVHMVRTP